jgi:signal peptidase I
MAAKGPRSVTRDYLEAIAWAVAITLALRTFVIQAFRIPSESMCDTLLVGDFLFVSKLDYGAKIPFTHLRLPGLHAPRRGEVIVFQWPEDPSKDFIKRCIATGGRRWKCATSRCSWTARQVEPYVKHTSSPRTRGLHAARQLQAAHGRARRAVHDGRQPRPTSNDSRFWGTVPMDLVKGRALFIYFSTGGTAWWNGLFHIRFGRLLKVIR